RSRAARKASGTTPGDSSSWPTSPTGKTTASRPKIDLPFTRSSRHLNLCADWIRLKPSATQHQIQQQVSLLLLKQWARTVLLLYSRARSPCPVQRSLCARAQLWPKLPAPERTSKYHHSA